MSSDWVSGGRRGRARVSRAVLTHHTATNRHVRMGTAPNNFPTTTLAGRESDPAREIVQDPYDRDLLALDPGCTERDLEDVLVARMTHTFTELGERFAFVGRQYRLPVGEQEFFIDLLFFHLEHCRRWSPLPYWSPSEEAVCVFVPSDRPVSLGQPHPGNGDDAVLYPQHPPQVGQQSRHELSTVATGADADRPASVEK